MEKRGVWFEECLFVNCRSAQQLISPYLDQQLTGAEMLAMQEHLKQCASCAAEYRQVCEVRLLLRSLSPVAPGKPLEPKIAQRVASAPGGGKFGARALRFGAMAENVSRPQRGRRLAGALALACAALLMLAAPFAPSTGDAARSVTAGQPNVMEADLAAGSVPPPLLSHLEAGAEAGRPLFGGAGNAQAWGRAPRGAGADLSQAGASVTLSGWSAAPLDDEAVGGYAAGDAAFPDGSRH